MKSVFLLATSLVLGLGSAIPASANCPMINGAYTKIVEVSGGALTYRLAHFTRVEGGVTSYTFLPDKWDEFFVADGKPHPISYPDFPPGKITIRCEDGVAYFSVSLDNPPPGYEPYRFWLKPVGTNILELHGHSTEGDGVYRLE